MKLTKKDLEAKYSEALTVLLQKDLARTSYFEVIIGRNNIDFTPFTKDIAYLCQRAELPGESLATTQQKIYGVIEKFPLMSNYSNLTLDFVLTGSDYDKIRLSFLSWITFATGRKNLINVNVPSSNLDTTYNIPYKDDITATIIINHYSVQHELLTSCRLIDAFPIQIGNSPLSMESKNNIMSLDVTFAYTEYEYYFYGTESTQDKSSLNIPFLNLKDL